MSRLQLSRARPRSCLAKRYLRFPDELGQEWLLTGSPQIPVIDMSKAPRQRVINHGIPEEVIRNMNIDIEEFFELLLGEKMAYEQLPNNMEVYGQAFVLSEDQKLNWGNMLFLLMQPPSHLNFRLWPKHPASFRATMEKYSSELKKVELTLLRATATNSRVNPDMFASLFEGGIQATRMNYYPPCPLATRVSGLTLHSDTTGITFLLQTSNVDGLQIKKNGKWLPIKPVPGALIINIVDIIEITRNGEYKSIEHVAMVNSEEERLSIAAFHSIKLKGTVEPLPDFVKKSGTLCKTLSHRDYVRLISSHKLDGKSTLYFVKLDSE